MPESDILSIRLPRKVKAKLEKLAKLSGRSKSWHAAEALDAYVDWQMPIVKSIVQAMEDGRAGKGVPLQQVKAETKAIIEAAKAKAKQRA